MKLCKTCDTEKEFTEFHRRNNIPNGRQSVCKSCRKLMDKIRNEEYIHKPNVKKRRLEYNKNWTNNTWQGRASRLRSGFTRKCRKYGLPQISDYIVGPELEKLFIKCNQSCTYCSEELNIRTVEFDHIIPISKGGLNTLSNLAPSCSPCNSRKNDKIL